MKLFLFFGLLDILSLTNDQSFVLANPVLRIDSHADTEFNPRNAQSIRLEAN